MGQLIRLTERVQQTGPFRVDESAGIIHGVRVLGLQSANGRRYLREAVSEAIRQGMYNGVPTNVDHATRPSEAHSVARRCGWLEQSVQESDGGVRARWHLLKTHPLTPMILEVANKKPTLLGLSHVADGSIRREGGMDIVESIRSVTSVDCVCDPATVRGFSEGTLFSRRSTMRLSKFIERIRYRRPEAARTLREMAEAGLLDSTDNVASSGMTTDDGIGTDDTVPDSTIDTAVRDAMRSAWTAIFDADDMDDAGKIAKAKAILKTLASVTATTSATSESWQRYSVAQSIRETMPVGLRPPVLEDTPAARARRIAEYRRAR